MKELKIKIGGVWSLVTAVLITAMLCASAVYISTQHNQTQRDVAETQADAIKQAGGDVGRGLCNTSTKTFTVCSGFGE